ncbi:MAG: DNA primase [Phycisphaerae bacterium]|nr:DNA primase [Phycisphaerae bacterium]
MAGIFDQSIVNQVQQANDIVDLISEHVSLKKKGREMVGLCPFHDDHRPSMYVNSTKQIFKCFACGAGGSIFTFVQMRENLTFPQTLQRLAERAGIKLKPLKTQDSKPKTDDVDPNELARVNAWAAKYFQQNLNDPARGKNAREYIAERKITPESIEQWQLGLAIAQNDLLRAAKAKNIPDKLLQQAGLVVSQAPAGLADKFVNRLMFPITDVTGRIIGFGGRTLDNAPAKYINSPATPLFDKSNALYGLLHARHQISTSGTAVAVEGYTDCIMAHQFQCSNVVATLGTSFTAGQARILRRYAKKVILVFDSDTAGMEAANRALEVCVSQRLDIKLASVPQGKDPCDFLINAGKKRFEKLLDDAVDVFKFKWDRLMDSFNSGDTLVDHKAAIEEFLQAIATAVWAGKVPAIDRGLIVNRLSKIIGTESKQINAELARRIARVARTASYSDTNAAQNKNAPSRPPDMGRGLYATAQREVLEVLLNEPALFDSVNKQIKPQDFDVPILRQIADIVFEILSANPAPSLKEILAKAESVEAGSAIVELARLGEEKANFSSRLTGALDAMNRLTKQRKKGQIKADDDQTKFLRRFSENTVKENPHNVGMT